MQKRTSLGIVFTVVLVAFTVVSGDAGQPNPAEATNGLQPALGKGTV